MSDTSNGKITGIIARTKAGSFFRIICLGAATAFAVRMGMLAYHTFSDGDLADGVVSSVLALYCIIIGVYILTRIIRNRGASVEYSGGVLSGEWGLFSGLSAKSGEITGMVLKGRSLRLRAGDKKYTLPALVNVSDLYRALREDGVPDRLYADLSDEELESRRKKGTATVRFFLICDLLSVVLLFVCAFLLSGLIGDADVMDADSEKVFCCFTVAEAATVLLSFALTNVTGMHKDNLNDVVGEMTARAAAPRRLADPPAWDYGEVVRNCRMYDDRFRMYIYRPDDDRGFSFAVEVFVPKSEKWRTVADFSDRFRFASPAEAFDAAMKIVQVDPEWKWKNETGAGYPQNENENGNSDEENDGDE